MDHPWLTALLVWLCTCSRCLPPWLVPVQSLTMPCVPLLPTYLTTHVYHEAVPAPCAPGTCMLATCVGPCMHAWVDCTNIPAVVCGAHTAAQRRTGLRAASLCFSFPCDGCDGPPLQQVVVCRLFCERTCCLSAGWFELACVTSCIHSHVQLLPLSSRTVGLFESF